MIAGSTLTALFDGTASTTIVLGSGSFATHAGAAAVCAAIQAGFRNAATGHTFVDALGDPIADPARVAELEQITCRWDETANAVFLSSGRRGYIDQLQPSTVAVTGGSAAAALGFDPPAHVAPGRHARHRAPAPKGFALDVRLDLWAASQRDLGYLVDALIQTIPTRTRMVTCPGLLAQDLAPGDTAIRLLDRGEPTLSASLLHLEAGDGFVDRATGQSLSTTAGATAESNPPRLRFAGTGVARRVVVATPSVPDPRRPEQAAPHGAALTLGIAFAGGAKNDSGRIASVEHDGHTLLGLDFNIVKVGPNLFVDLIASADLKPPGSNFATASITRRVALDALGAGVSIHVVVHAARGAVTIDVDGKAQDLDDTSETPIPPVQVPGVPSSGDGMTVVLGNPAGNPLAFSIDHAHLVAAPLPVLDPSLRASTSSATRFRPGDHIALGYSDNGYMPGGDVERFYVRSVSGDTITLDRPVSGTWRRGRTLVHSRDCFLHQKYVKRRDDLMNRLYRYSIGYRVSTLLEQPDTAVVGGLVVQPVVALELQNYPKRAGSASPGVQSIDASIDASTDAPPGAHHIRVSQSIQE